jgi:hypothetical protein
LEEQTIQAWEKTINSTHQLIKEVLENKDLNKKEKKQPTRKISSIKITDFIETFEESTFGSNNKLINFTIGLIDNKSIENLSKVLGNGRSAISKAKTILNELSSDFRNKFRKLVWNYRCELMAQVDKTRGLKTKTKKKKRNPIK